MKLNINKVHWQIMLPDTVQAYCTQRQGGVSQEPYSSLNLGSHVGDDSHAVEKNRTLLQAQLNLPNQPIWLNQEHTSDILIYDEQTAKQQSFLRTPYDAIYTQLKGAVCCVMTADCMPLLVSNRQGTEVAAIHAGWRGMADNIIEKTLEHFSSTKQDIVVWAGPTISQINFEVGKEVQAALGGSAKHYLDHEQDKNKCYADLYALAAERIENYGAHFSHSQACTYKDVDQYFSYRRDGTTGRQASLIWIDRV